MDMPPELAAATRKRSEEQVAKYNALDAQGKAVADLGDWIFRQKIKRSNEHYDAVIEEVERTGNFNLLQHEDLHLPASTATVAEAKAMKAIFKIKTGWETEPEPWQEVAAFLRDRRNFSQTELNQGDPVDPNWHADHME